LLVEECLNTIECGTGRMPWFIDKVDGKHGVRACPDAVPIAG
jgi:hypothetical protein